MEVRKLDVRKWFSYVDHCCRPFCNETLTWHTTTFHSQLVECQLSLKCMYWIWLEIYNTAGLLVSLQAECFSTLGFILSCKVTSSFNLILVLFFWYTNPYWFLELRHGDCHPAVWKLSFSRRKPHCSPQQLFMLACVHPLYMNTWAAFVSQALYQVTRHGCTVCLMEMLCRKRPCGSLEYMYIRNGILVSSP